MDKGGATEIQPFGVFVRRRILAAHRDLTRIPNAIEAFASYWKPDSSPTTDDVHSQHPQSTPGTSSDNQSPTIKKPVISKERGSLCDTIVTTVDGQKFDTKDLDNDRGMAMVADWSLPIFEIAEKHNKTVLSRIITEFTPQTYYTAATTSPVIRYLVLEYILATDLKQHFEIIMTFNEKSSEMELQNESDRLLMAKMVIKMADINSPTKPYALHRQWTDRICQEFYEQGDEERRRGMPITPYMDREDAQVAKLQDSFIAHVVSPLALAMNEAGLLPILPGLVEPEMIINLKHNHQKWLQEIDTTAAEQGTGMGNGVIEEESSTSDSPDNRKCSPSLDSEVEEQFDMCTIHEHDEEEYL
ncbi:3'5'-cyclic nucleotide phosphodiesterase [Teladorsagia circumcincta]|uniref:3'5'-cyclic nucleotide phosphodiesterase n=1 Tax=Teladorsagia circumcincta TaxID=45464 RepID=A0A2G9UWJ3_TELCI|nr:3'5'-cyclic nucleotide phosphodiesterase [Teladorsagia circumcincta]